MSVFNTPFDQLLQDFFGGIDPEKDLVLTANKRLRRFLIERYDALQPKSAFASLQCLSYSAWLQQLWLDAQFLVPDDSVAAVLLTPTIKPFRKLYHYCSSQPIYYMPRRTGPTINRRTAWPIIIPGHMRGDIQSATALNKVCGV